ncbi:prolipoprotein diacylglyceryl transferase [Candidatus Desulfovibrio trichonymphae]|uniref:prolipoprotein diacylglyceryl transferase n=1 Tax=Candidatus Desulfovibrio trichonymphae TaxID=1725232 RepID=UPI001554369C|nr:prolipoprotein diacylglyceryl transferase [Candidatus Desulfovibrio trichonymphae]
MEKVSFFPVDPVVFSLGGLHVRWYGLMYLFGFAAGWGLGRRRASRSVPAWPPTAVDDLLTCAMLGVIVGGRLGYVLFYDLVAYIREPWEILRLWNGGMSFHGGLLGVLLAFAWFARSRGKAFLAVSDFVAPLVPPGLFFGRIGNFINSELWGKVSDVPWAVVFPGGGPWPRHPSQLYEAFLEGLVLFVLLWAYSSRPRKTGAVSGLFAAGYGLARFCVEFVRVPDTQLGYLAFGWLTMGQILCLPLIGIGLWLLFRADKEM